jgi:hypothetical protein
MSRSIRSLIPFLFILLFACKSLQPEAWAPSPLPPSALPFTPSPSASATARPTDRPTDQPTHLPVYQPTPVPARPFTLRVHPDGPIYAGDQVSFEIIPSQPTDLKDRQVQIDLQTAEGPKQVSAGFGEYGIGARQQATLLWAWDTRGLPAGDYPLQFSLQPDELTWVETVHLLPRGQLPPPEPQAAWAMTSNRCCNVYYITGSQAAVELPELLKSLDEQARLASQRMGVELTEPIPVVLLPRVLGHGGFASKEITVSHLARNYMGGSQEIIFHHEMIHLLDARLGGDFRPSALVEGLAVYLSGGHFKPEPLLDRAAALLPPEPGCTAWSPASEQAEPAALGCGVDRYIPLARLFDHFYFEQHEIGYLQAGALVEFVVETWGWEEFSAFYRDIHQPSAPQVTPQAEAAPTDTATANMASRAVDAASQAHFGLTLQQLEERFISALRQQRASPADAEDVGLTVQFYDTARRYQQLLDPSAHFLTAWLLDNEQMRQREIVADYLRRPARPENYALETMLVSANDNLRDGDLAEVISLLDAVHRVLDDYPSQGLQAFAAHPLAADYLALVQSALDAGYQPQRIELLANGTARMWVTTHGPQLSELSFTRLPSGWALY